MSKVELHLTPYGGDGRIVVDGQELRGVTKVTLEGSVHEQPRLVLDLALIEETSATGDDVEVTVAGDTAATLRALGWTPLGQTP